MCTLKVTSSVCYTVKTSLFGENHITTLVKKQTENSSDEVDKFQALLFE